MLLHTLITTALLCAIVCADDGLVNSPDEDRHKFNAGRKLSVGYLVYTGYAPLDLWGPVQIITALSRQYNMTLSFISKEAGPVGSAYPMPYVRDDGSIMDPLDAINTSVIATHSIHNAPPLDLLLVPGGRYNMTLETWMPEFVKARFDDTDYVASVCSGAEILSRAGVLDGRRATANKYRWTSVVQHGPNVSWVPNARWVHDGKVWTSSGVAAGMDMAYALFSWMYGSEKLNTTMNIIELAPHTKADWDPYAVVHKVPGADLTRPLKDVVAPAGYD